MGKRPLKDKGEGARVGGKCLQASMQVRQPVKKEKERRKGEKKSEKNVKLPHYSKKASAGQWGICVPKSSVRGIPCSHSAQYNVSY